jgi:transposase-like protein
VICRNLAHLRGLRIDRPNQVWAADITCQPIGRGFLYLAAVMDWASRAVLSWRLSNTMDVSFCIEALEEALARFGKPEIFNTDQGSQFTSAAFTGVLEQAGIQISMDGRGRWMDNVFIERLWRSLKHEDVYLKGYADGREVRHGIAAWVEFYNRKRPHKALGLRRVPLQKATIRGILIYIVKHSVAGDNWILPASGLAIGIKDILAALVHGVDLTIVVYLCDAVAIITEFHLRAVCVGDFCHVSVSSFCNHREILVGGRLRAVVVILD